MPKLSIALAVFTGLAASTVAHADTYNFTISTGSSSMGSPAATFVASGTLTGTPDATATTAAIDLMSVSGAAQGYTFVSVASLSTPASFSFDNLLYTGATATHVDAEGILLYLQASNIAGESLAHIYDVAGTGAGSGYHVDVFDPNDPADVTPFALDTFDLSPAAVPEPSTLTLLGTGVLTLAGTFRRRLTR